MVPDDERTGSRGCWAGGQNVFDDIFYACWGEIQDGYGVVFLNVVLRSFGHLYLPGIIMALHLFTAAKEAVVEPSSSRVVEDLRLLCAYENGGVTLRRYSRTDKRTSVEGVGWDVVWDVKLHVESSTPFYPPFYVTHT